MSKPNKKKEVVECPVVETAETVNYNNTAAEVKLSGLDDLKTKLNELSEELIVVIPAKGEAPERLHHNKAVLDSAISVALIVIDDLENKIAFIDKAFNEKHK